MNRIQAGSKEYVQWMVHNVWCKRWYTAYLLNGKDDNDGGGTTRPLRAYDVEGWLEQGWRQPATRGGFHEPD